MALLQDILMQMGIEEPFIKRKTSDAAEIDWHLGEHFVPQEGQTYELIFAKMPYAASGNYAIRKVRILGEDFGDWFDVDEERPLDRKLRTYTVKAFRKI